MNIGENIRTLRKAKGLSQKQLANLIGVTQPMVAQMERGTKAASLQLGVEIAKVLDCDIRELVS